MLKVSPIEVEKSCDYHMIKIYDTSMIKMRYYLSVNVLHRCGKPTIYDSRLVHIDVNVYPRVTEASIVSASTVNECSCT